MPFKNTFIWNFTSGRKHWLKKATGYYTGTFGKVLIAYNYPWNSYRIIYVEICIIYILSPTNYYIWLKTHIKNKRLKCKHTFAFYFCTVGYSNLGQSFKITSIWGKWLFETSKNVFLLYKRELFDISFISSGYAFLHISSLQTEISLADQNGAPHG